MKHLEERAFLSQEKIRQSIYNLHAQCDEVMRAAVEKHFGGDPMDHVAECSLQIQPGHQAFRGNPAKPLTHRLIRNRDGKVLAEVKIHISMYEHKLEWRIFE